jgi:hypothetical protein
MEHYANAAVRHYANAQVLREAGQLDNAGHLVGFAGECAVKHHITTLKPSLGAQRAHWPTLLLIARKHLNSRGAGNVFLQSLFSGWTVERRYAQTGHTTHAELVSWFKDARRLLAVAKIKGQP